MSKKNPFHYEVVDKDSGNPEIHIYGFIGEGEEIEYKHFQNTFRNLVKNNKNLTQRIHCGGGSVFEGFAIYDLIRSSECKVKTIVEGMAASMGSILALAGDTIEMAENAFFMLHAPTVGAWGDKNKIEGTLKLLVKCEERLFNIYKERTTASDETIRDWFDGGKDAWLDAEQSLEIKLCDSINKPKKTRKLENKIEVENKTQKEIFETLSNKLKIDPKITNSKSKTQEMKKQLVLMMMSSGLFAVNAMTEETPDIDVQKHLDTLIAKAKKADDLQTELEGVKETNATALVATALRSGKITASEKEQWEGYAKDNYAMASTALTRMSGKPDPNNKLDRQPPSPDADPDQPEVMNGREKWTFDQWQEKDPKGLAKLENESQEAFDKLFNQKFNA